MSLENLRFGHSPENRERYEAVRDVSLDLLAEQLKHHNPPGYPAFADRFRAEELPYINGIDPHIVSGPWSMDLDLPTSQERRKLWLYGIKFDAHGRPCHPWLRQMVERPDIGVVTGKGFFRHWGPNYTVDPIVLRGDDVLLVQRKDTGLWALPGGFIEEGEPIATAAAREVLEETGIELPVYPTNYSFYEGPVADIRTTANAWPVTDAIIYELPTDFNAEPVGADDAQAAAWVPLEQAKNLPLYGSHSLFLSNLLINT